MMNVQIAENNLEAWSGERRAEAIERLRTGSTTQTDSENEEERRSSAV